MRRELAEFLDYCRLERRLAPLTCSAYERDVGACLTFLECEAVDALANVRPADLRRFLAEEGTRRPAPSSRARTVAALKCFFRFLVENEELERDPARVLRTPRKRRRCPTYSTGASSPDCSPRRNGVTSGSGGTPASASATDSCLRSLPTPDFGAASCSGSIETTSTSNGVCSECGGRKATGSASFRFTPRSCRSWPTT
jgi:hypothetical protein